MKLGKYFVTFALSAVMLGSAAMAGATPFQPVSAREKEPGDNRGLGGKGKPGLMAREKEPGDDRGRGKGVEPGDDRGRGKGKPGMMAREKEPGDNRGKGKPGHA